MVYASDNAAAGCALGSREGGALLHVDCSGRSYGQVGCRIVQACLHKACAYAVHFCRQRYLGCKNREAGTGGVMGSI
jgi:hypothetical protein